MEFMGKPEVIDIDFVPVGERNLQSNRTQGDVPDYCYEHLEPGAADKIE